MGVSIGRDMYRILYGIANGEVKDVLGRSVQTSALSPTKTETAYVTYSSPKTENRNTSCVVIPIAAGFSI